jgi:GAF domain-containing protein
MSTRPFGKGLTEHVIKSRKSLLLREDVADATLKLGIDRVVTGEEAKCWLGVPMISQDRVIGVMTVQSTRKAGLYDEDHERLLSAMANQAAGAVANARGYSELEERLTELSVFNEIGTALGSVLEFDELLNVIYEQTRRVMDADQLYISLYDEKTKTIEFPLVIEAGRRVMTSSRKFGNSISERVITTRKPLLIKRDFRKTLQNIGADIILEEGEAEPLCWLGVPMISQNKVMGVMVVQNVDKEEVFDEDDLHILTTIANQAAGAIANARAYSQVEDQLTARSVINEISRAISSTLDVNKIYGVIHKQIKRLLNADNFYIALYNKELDEVSFPYAFQDGEIQGWGSRSAGKGMTEYVLSTGKGQLFRGGSKEEATRRGVEHIGKPSHSWLGVPMIMRNEVIGVMAVQSFDAQIRYSERDMGLMQMVAGQAAGAVVNARAYAMLERSGEELKALLETSSAVSATLEEEKVAHLIAVKATELIGANGCTVYRFDPGIEELVPVTTTVAEGREEVLGHHISVGEGITGQAAAEKRAILANNVHHNSKAARIPGTKELPTCLLSAPLMARGDLLGVMTLARFSEKEFVDHDLELFILFARQVAEAAANSRLFGRLRELNKDLERRGEELGALFNTSTELSSTLDEEEVGELIAQKATELIGADGCTVYRFDPETEKLIPQITTNKKNTEAVMGYHPSLGEGTTGRAVKERRPILANHVHLESKSAHIPGTKREPTCLLSAPLISKGELLGGMTISRLSDREFTEHDLQVFTLFARQAAEAFANSRLFGRLRNLNKDLQARREELQALFKTSTELSSILEEEETGKLIAQRAKELIASSGCTFYKFDKESAKLIPIATTVMEEYEQRMAYQVPLGEGITGRAAKERNPILANNIHLDPKAPRVPGTEDLPTCLLSAPLVARGELLGTMTLVRMSEDEFTEHDLQLFTLFVRQAAEAFANTRLFTQLRELNESLEQKVAERTTELEQAKIKLEEVHSDYKERVRSRLATLAPVMEKVSLGDFNENISLHEEEDEFTELFVGLNLMIDDLRFMFEENRRRGEELKELNEDLQRRSGELRELLDASTAVAATLEEEQVAELIGDRATNFIRAARCTVYRFDPEAEELIPQMTTSKEDRDKILGYKIKLAEGVTGRAAAERKSIIANNVHLDPKAPRIPGTQERPTCLLSVPLLSKGELLGVMTLTRLSEEEFIEHDRELFTLFARQVADATANSRLLSRLQDLNENLEAIVAQRTSELKESNRKTAAFARELEEVIYVTSHDLKTPLRAISGFSQFLYEDYRDKLDMEGKLYLTRLIDAVKRMEKLLDDVLEISAVTRTGQVFKDVPAGDLIKEAIKMVDVGDDADIIYNPDELPTVLCDSAKMVEVFYNLISNGLKFNDKPRKQVKITAQTSGGAHEFIFSDNGIGIEKRHYERIFQIFQRLHQREDYSGTGVGLSMVKRVVEEHNGRIWVESQVGVGTIFHFTLPLHQEKDNEAANPERSM